jgi:hypothetical protein
MTTKPPTKSGSAGTRVSAEPNPEADQAPVDDAPRLPEETPAEAEATESKKAKAARLRAELAELERNDAGAEPAEPTHVLLLANGDSVETAFPGATHHATEEGGQAFPVVSRFELARGEV